MWTGPTSGENGGSYTHICDIITTIHQTISTERRHFKFGLCLELFQIDATFDLTERAAGFNVQTSGNTKTEHQQSMSAKYKSFKWKVSITDKVPI